MPNVFLSHSGKDSIIINKIGTKIKEITGQEIPIFLSSDGQSLKLGKNWVSQIEAALKDSVLMFVFLSNHSIGSPWVLFELGHAYGRTIDVVPVGLPGIDIGSLPQPISLIQGFNIQNHNSMNNLISKINERFDKSYPLNFTQDDFERIFHESSSNAYRNTFKYIESIVFYLQDKLKYSFIDIIPESYRIFRDKKIPIQYTDNLLNLDSLKLLHETGISPERITATLYPSLSNKNIENFNFIINGVRESGLKGVSATVFFNNLIIKKYESIRIIPLTHDEGIRFAPKNGLIYNNIHFILSSSSPHMTITILDDADPFENLDRLVEILYEKNIISSI